MANTSLASTMSRTWTFDGAHQIDRPVADTNWRIVGSVRVQRPSLEAWAMGASLIADVDPGVTGEIRLRAAIGNVASAAITVSSYTGPMGAGWPVLQWGTSNEQHIFIEARRVSGSGGVRVLHGAVTLLVDPPGAPTPTFGFRTVASPAVQTPTVTPAATELEHPDGGTIYAGGAGTTHVVSTVAQAAAARAVAVAGDYIKIIANISGVIDHRADKFGLPAGNANDGAEGNPIIWACAPGVWIDPGDNANNDAALDIWNCDHVWAVGVNVRNSQFGIRFWNAVGTAANPFRVAHCTIEDTGHAGLAIQGWDNDIAADGGTPPAGNGNEWGYSSQFVCEANTITRPGRLDTQFGEGIYFGHGGSPGWISRADHGTIRYNTIEYFTADGIDIKPGCHHLYGYGNLYRYGQAHFGAALNLCYVAAVIDDRPAWSTNIDPNIWFEGERIYDFNVTNTFSATSSNWPIYIGLSGMRLANLLIWGVRDAIGQSGAGSAAQAIRVRIEKPIAQFGTHDTHVVNSVFWCAGGVRNDGDLTDPAPGIVERNNIVPAGLTGGTHTATAADFAGTIPAEGTTSDADQGFGLGSAFELDTGSALVGAGVSITDLTLHLDEDIRQVAIPASNPNPGPYQ